MGPGARAPGRADPGTFPLGGRRAVTEAIRAGRARRVLIARQAQDTEGLLQVLEATRSAGVETERVDRGALEALGAADDQGVVAFVVPPPERSDRELDDTEWEPDSLVVVLDGITDPQNLGACARAAEAAGAGMLVARRRRAAPLTAAAIRASAGALLHLPVARVTNIARTIERLRDRGFTAVGLDHTATVTIHEGPPPPRPLAVVVGDEGAGLSRLVRERCDLLVSIPMRGETASLNASSALAVALFGYANRPD
jgi:23S rRNA (guanosine2251-2'-O)-methyltransferase